MQSLPFQAITIQWVLGHQLETNEDIATEALYNIRADYLAGQVPSYPTIPQCPLLPAARCKLEIDNTTVSSHYTKRIRNAVTLPDYYDYLDQRYGWDPDTRHQINWVSFTRATHHQSASPVQLLKLVYSKLPTNSELSKSNPHLTDKCHYCNARETFLHLCRCDNPTSTEFRTELEKSVNDYLTAKDTSDLFSIPFRRYLHTTLYRQGQVHCTVACAEGQTCIHQQDRLGDHALLRGFLVSR